MLPASSNASPSTSNSRRNPATDRFLTALVIVSMLYTLLLGWALLARLVPFQAAYLLMAVPCLAPVLWYAYGFLRVRETTQDFGLLTSALGWAFILIALLVKHTALIRDLRSYEAGTLVINPGQSQVASIFFIAGVLALFLGAIISANAWVQAARRGEIE